MAGSKTNLMATPPTEKDMIRHVESFWRFLRELDARIRAIESAAAATASGDVRGPASAVDGEIAVFSGTTGKRIRSSGRKLTEYARKADADDLLFASGKSIVLIDTVTGARRRLKISDGIIKHEAF